jgi:hypothetical protein
MRGCSFAENFISEALVALNNGVAGVTGGTIDHGLTTDGTGRYKFDVVAQAGDFSAVVKFATTTNHATTPGSLLTNLGVGQSGFIVYVEDGKVSATMSTGAALETAVSVSLDYDDGEEHTVTYVVNKTAGTHTLYVDDLAAATGSISITGSTGQNLVYCNGGNGVNFIGTTYEPRIFDALLTQEEHDLYHAGTIASWFMSPWASYRCDEICDDTEGNKVWDRTVERRDMTKGDGSTATTFPTFVDETDTEDAHYDFDGLTDFLTAPTLPDDYLISICRATPFVPWPVVDIAADLTDLADLTTAGQFFGSLYGLTIHSGTFTTLEELEAEYRHLYWQHRGRAYGMYHRLITQGHAKLVMFLDSTEHVFRDYSRGRAHAWGVDVTRNDAEGCEFGSAGSHVAVVDQASLRVLNGTICAFGDFGSGSDTVAGDILDKGSNYRFRYSISGGTLQMWFLSSTYSRAIDSDEQIDALAVTWKDGEYPRFFVNGEYEDDGNATVSPDDTDTTNPTIGNNNELSNRLQSSLKQVLLGDQPLTDYEVKALYNQARAIGEIQMETGSRTRTRNVYTAVAVDQDVDPGAAFQLIEVTLNFDTAPATSEDLTIKIANGDSDDATEVTYDPSENPGTSYVFTFNKRYPNNSTIKIDYPNTDGRTITVNTVHQTDDSVA